MARTWWLLPVFCFALFQVAWMTAVTTWVLWRVVPMYRAPTVTTGAQPRASPPPAGVVAVLPPLFTREGVPLYFETRRRQIESELRAVIRAAGVVRDTKPNCKVCVCARAALWGLVSHL